MSTDRLTVRRFRTRAVPLWVVVRDGQYVGVESTFQEAWKRVDEFLHARLADDEGFAQLALAGESHPHSSHLSDPVGAMSSGCPTCMGMLGTHERILAEVAAKRAILEHYENWPVLVEKREPNLERIDPDDPWQATYLVTQQINWLTTQEYRKRFGDEPPAAPMVRAMAAIYASHPQYREEWA